MKRILFVDDSVVVRRFLSMTLGSLRSRWDLEFAESGAEALELLAIHPFAAVISDMQMPEMSGVELLDIVRNKYPHIIRIVVSGNTDTDSMVQIMTSAHQSLPEPCNVAELQTVLERTIALTETLHDEPVMKFISRLKAIPSLPLLYTQVAEEMQSDDPSPKRLGEIISKDMAMTAKVLQMANSAVHGVRSVVTGVEQAVLVLGLDAIRTMVLSASIFAVFDSQAVGFATTLWDNSLRVSEMAVRIAVEHGIKPCEIGPYQSAGILHDIGKLVMVSADPMEYRNIEALAKATGKSQYEIERKMLWCGHPEIGAYLLGLWGLPSSIVEAVAWHHQPSQSPVDSFGPLTAVHMAIVRHSQSDPAYPQEIPSLDLSFMERIHIGKPEEGWNGESVKGMEEAVA